jgi:hypothetical protein
MPLFRICWFDGELVEMRRAAGLRELVGELLDEWIDDPDICPLEVFGWLAAQRVVWSASDETHGEKGTRTAAADAVRRVLADSDVAVRLFLIACAGTLTCVERL